MWVLQNLTNFFAWPYGSISVFPQRGSGGSVLGNQTILKTWGLICVKNPMHGHFKYLYNTIVGPQANFHVSYPTPVTSRVKYIGKGVLKSHLASNLDLCCIQNRIITNYVIKRLRCITLSRYSTIRWYGPRQANLVLIAYASSEGSGEPVHPRSLARTSAACSYKQWVKRNLQTESLIPGPSEWLGMRN